MPAMRAGMPLIRSRKKGSRRQKVSARANPKSDGKSPVHGDEDRQRRADHRERAVHPPAPRHDLRARLVEQAHASGQPDSEKDAKRDEDPRGRDDAHGERPWDGEVDETGEAKRRQRSHERHRDERAYRDAPDSLERHAPDWLPFQPMVCGVRAFTRPVREFFQEIGFDRRAVRMENYD